MILLCDYVQMRGGYNFHPVGFPYSESYEREGKIDNGRNDFLSAIH
jgi:hypothetical protein